MKLGLYENPIKRLVDWISMGNWPASLGEDVEISYKVMERQGILRLFMSKVEIDSMEDAKLSVCTATVPLYTMSLSGPGIPGVDDVKKQVTEMGGSYLEHIQKQEQEQREAMLQDAREMAWKWNFDEFISALKVARERKGEKS